MVSFPGHSQGLQVGAVPSGRLRASPLPPPESTGSALSVIWDDGNSYRGLSFPVCKREVERAQALKELLLLLLLLSRFSCDRLCATP